MLPMIMAAAEGKSVLGPNDLRAHLEAGGLKGLLDFTRVPTRMPDICDRAWKQHPSLPPIGAIIVSYFAELAGVEIYASALSPGRIVIHPIRRVSDHQVGFDPGQQSLRIVVGGAVTTDKSMGAKNPKIARPSNGLAGQIRHVIRIGQPVRHLRG